MTSKGVAYSATAAGYILDYTVIAGLGIVTVGAMCPGMFFMANGAPGCLPLDVLSSTRQTKRNIESSPHASPDQQPKNEAGARPPQSSDADDDLPSGALGPRIYH